MLMLMLFHQHFLNSSKFAAIHTSVVFFGTYSFEIYLIHVYLFKKLFWLCEMMGGLVGIPSADQAEDRGCGDGLPQALFMKALVCRGQG